jgi:hypothetical protein
MSLTQKTVVAICSVASFLGFCLWFCFNPDFEPAIGIIGSIGTLATTYWPQIKRHYVHGRLKGQVTFDYSNNNGSYIIGNGELVFETKWSKASDTSIHIYNDPLSISGVALAQGAACISDISNAAKYDMSSRSRTVQEGEVVILKNKHGNYAALSIIDIKDRTRSDTCDELTFEFVINPNAKTSFV